MLYTKDNGNVLTKKYLLKMFDGKNQNKLLNLLSTFFLFTLQIVTVKKTEFL